MANIFLSVLNMSVTTAIVILFVLSARLLLKNCPKIFSYALWVVVLFRLLCPVSVTTAFSLLGLFDPPVTETTEYTTSFEYVAPSLGYIPDVGTPSTFPSNITPAPSGGHSGIQTETPTQNTTPAKPSITPLSVAAIAWLTGIGFMALYGVLSFVKVKRQLIGSVCLKENIHLADHIDSPFVMGIVRPKIYLPSSLPAKEQGYIILHEQHHIRRCDHIIKGLAFLALCIHWFNPLVWLAFLLSSKDMEMSCDEAVLKKLGDEIRYDYSASLLSLATGRRIFAGTPLAFGEGDTKSRIKNMLNWKKPKVWISVAATFICITVVTACAGNPKANPDQAHVPPNGSHEGSGTQTTSPSSKETSVPPLNTHASETQPAGNVTPAPEKALAEDAAYYFELALSGKEFRAMDAEKSEGLLAEYEDLLDGYTLIARETTDGKASYIVGQYNGDPTQSPLHGMYSVEFNDKWGQLVYCEEDSASVDEALTDWKEPTVGYSIKKSRIFWSPDSQLIFIQPKGTELGLDVAWNRYLYTPNGREYITDAVSRGIDICGTTTTFLYVYRITEEFGEIAERIALTDQEAAAILAEEKVQITDGLGFSASLHIDGQTTYYNEYSGIPQTVLDLAVERCDYRFGDPGMITDTIREAQLNCSWLDAPLYAKEDDLPRLREILKNSEKGYIGACGYGAVLKLTFTGGEKLTVFKGTDNCDTIAFGSYSGYFLGDKENTEFWTIFGLDPDTKSPT